MLIAGWGDRAKSLGDGFVHTCRNCNNLATWQIYETTHRVSLYFIPIAKWGYKYAYACPVCQRGIRLPSRKVAQLMLAEAFESPNAPSEELLARLESLM